MKIDMLIYGDESADYSKRATIVRNAFTSISNTEVKYPNVYSRLSLGLKEIESAVKNSDMIVIFADDNIFLRAKEAICRSFSFQMTHSDAVLNNIKASSLTTLSRDDIEKHTAFPKNSTVFPLYNGLYSGFAIHSSKQCIMLLPFSDERLFPTMKKYVFPYIQRVYSIHPGNFYNHVIAYSASVLSNALKKTKSTISIANTPFCRYIAHSGKKVDDWNSYVNYAPYDKKHADRNTSELSANQARDNYNYDYGISVIESPKKSEGVFSYLITITNGKKATLRNISSLPDESRDDFIDYVVSELFLMTAEYITDPRNKIRKSSGKKKPKNQKMITGPMIILFILLFIIAFIATYIITKQIDNPNYFSTLIKYITGNMQKASVLPGLMR